MLRLLGTLAFLCVCYVVIGVGCERAEEWLPECLQETYVMARMWINNVPGGNLVLGHRPAWFSAFPVIATLVDYINAHVSSAVAAGRDWLVSFFASG